MTMAVLILCRALLKLVPFICHGLLGVEPRQAFGGGDRNSEIGIISGRSSLCSKGCKQEAM